MKWIVSYCFLIVSVLCHAQSLDRMDGIMVLTGTMEEEQLSEQVLERFESLERHPVPINLASSGRLLSSGLFSQYQVASLLDYRKANGDILSIEELSAVDGFGKRYAEALRPYVSMFSRSMPGMSGRPGMGGSSMIRSVWSPEPSDLLGSISAKGRVSLDYGTRVSAFLSGKLSLQSGRPEPSYGYTFHAVWNGKAHLDRIIAGDFNARFGQGLTCWSGFSMSGLSAPSSMLRRPTGLSASASTAGTGLRGLAAASSWGRISLSVFAGLPWYEDGKWQDRIIPGFNAACMMRYGSVSITGISRMSWDGDCDLSRVGADARFCIRGVDIFGETAVDLAGMSMAGLGGVIFPMGKSRLGLVGRYYPMNSSREFSGAVRSGTYVKDELGAGLSFERGSIVVATDYYRKLSTGREQYRIMLTDQLAIGPVWQIKPKLSCRSDLRTEVRLDFVRTMVPWTSTVRAHWLHCSGHAGLVYYEHGYRIDALDIFIRATVFHVDSWDDRIYTYERDAPGNFSMPAYYGRGAGLAANVAWKPRLDKGRLKMYATLSYKHAAKPGREPEDSASLRLQCAFDF